MTEIIIRKLNDIFNIRLLTDEDFKRIFDSPLYRISYKTYKSERNIFMYKSECVCFVKSGACQFEGGGKSIQFQAGVYKEVPSGDYTICNIKTPLEIISIWEVPKKYRMKSE